MLSQAQHQISDEEREEIADNSSVSMDKYMSGNVRKRDRKETGDSG